MQYSNSIYVRTVDTAPQLLDALFCGFFPYPLFTFSPFLVISIDQFSSSLILSCVKITDKPTKGILHFYYFFSLLIYYLTLFCSLYSAVKTTLLRHHAVNLFHWSFNIVIIVILNFLPDSSTICVISESDLLIALSLGNMLGCLLPFQMPPIFLSKAAHLVKDSRD